MSSIIYDLIFTRWRKHVSKIHELSNYQHSLPNMKAGDINNNMKLECGPMPNVMAAQPNISGALCKSSVIPFLVACRKFCLMPTARVLCSNAANIGACKTWDVK